MKAIILCAGFGKRMKPYTEKYQKSMILIHGKPLLEYILNGLIFAGLRDFIIVVGYRKEQIIDYFKEGKKWGVKIQYIEQKKINGTGGALLICEDLIQENHFFLTWGDIVVSYPIYKKVIEIFKQENQDYILVANYANDPHKGAAVYYEKEFCTGIIEKPPLGKSKSKLNNTGVFIFSIEIFNILRTINPSTRGEIELTDAINSGISRNNWQVRLLKMKKKQFRGDFGDIKVFEQLNKEKKWLNKLFQ
ncbi:MAG: nucleotidyltransferase family protein [Promethearchaeota archaeon]